MTAPTSGVFDRPQGGDPYAPEPSNAGKKTGLIITLALVAALIIGGGAFAVTRVLGGGGDQPSSALPGDSAAYVRMDIDPSVGQKIAAVRFLQDLDPEVTETLQSDDMRREFFEMIAEEEPSLSGIDYDADIEPWLGDRLGVGIVPQGDDEPQVAVALQVKDEGAAEEGLTKLFDEADGSDEAGWFFHGDYAVLSSAEQIDAVQSAVEAGTLADNETFTGDIEALGDEGILSFWADGEKLAPYFDEAGQALDEVEDPTGMSPGSLGGFLTSSPLEDAETGRVAAAVRFGEDHIELHGITRGFPVQIEDADTAQLVLDLPEDTAVALGQEHGDQLVALAYEQMNKVMPEEMAQLQSEASAQGFEIPGDIQTLVGQSLAIGVGAGVAEIDQMQDPSDLPAVIRVQTDTDAANAIIDKAVALSGASPEEVDQYLVRRADDGVLSLGMSQSYVDGAAEGGGLGDNATFQSAVPNAADADSVFYVNLNAFEQYYLSEITDENTRSSVEQIAAVGLSASWSGEDGEFTLRVVAD